MVATGVGPVPLTLAELLGSSNATQLPHAYINRGIVEEAFTRGLAARTHVVVFGIPGVGKSALIRHNIDWSDLIFVECLRGQQAPDVYRSVLSEAGARIKTETRLTKKRRLSATLKFFAADTERGTENTESEVTIDLGNVGDVFRVLRSGSNSCHFVMLNDFHLLARGVQRRLISDLQYVFERTGIRVIIVGNWTSQAYLSDLNSSLPSFVTDVHVSPWSDDDLVKVLNKVEQVLNVSFANDVADELIIRSAGSVRELADNCRLILMAAGVGASQAQPKAIDNIEQLHEISQQRMVRLTSRYADLLSSYLTATLYTIEGVDIGPFLVRVASDLMAGMGDQRSRAERKDKYSFDELSHALTGVVDASNEPTIAEQSRRRKLIESIAVTIRQRGASNVSVSLQSVVDAACADMLEGRDALRRSAKNLLRAQAKYGFNPPLLAYDPRGNALIAIDSKFRAFLRTESGEIESLQRIDLTPVDQDQELGWRTKWHDVIKEAAATNRWLAQNAASEDSA